MTPERLTMIALGLMALACTVGVLAACIPIATSVGAYVALICIAGAVLVLAIACFWQAFKRN